MKYLRILILLAFVISVSCSAGVSTNSISATPTPRQTTPLAATAPPVETPISTKEKRPLQVIKGGPLCESYLLAKIDSLRAPRTQLVRLKGFSPKNETLSSELKKWLE